MTAKKKSDEVGNDTLYAILIRVENGLKETNATVKNFTDNQIVINTNFKAHIDGHKTFSRFVLSALGGIFLLFVGSCIAFVPKIYKAYDDVDKIISEKKLDNIKK